MEKEQEVQKVIMIGGNTPEMTKAVIETLNKKAKGAKIYELEQEEMTLITERRMNRAASDQVKEYLEDEENKTRAKAIAQEYVKVFGEHFKNGYVRMTDIKRMTKYSWKDFNASIASLDMFGLVEWEDNKKKALKIIISDEDILENKKREAQQILDLAKGKLLELQDLLPTKAAKAKVETIKKKLKLSV